MIWEKGTQDSEVVVVIAVVYYSERIHRRVIQGKGISYEVHKNFQRLLKISLLGMSEGSHTDTLFSSAVKCSNMCTTFLLKKAHLKFEVQGLYEAGHIGILCLHKHPWLSKFQAPERKHLVMC